MPRVAPAKTAKLIDRIEPALAAEAERAVRAAGALPQAKLTRLKLTKEAFAELERQLVERGLERGPKALRVPIDQQILALLEGGGRLPLKDVPRRVKGAARPEIATAIDRLVRAGEARAVIRTQLEVLVGTGERTLEAAEIAQLVKVAAQLGKVLKKVTAKGRQRTLLREDFAAILGPFADAPRAPAAAADSPRDLVADALRRLEDPVLKLARIPDLVRALAGRLDVTAVHRALMEAADGGTIELRPESGGEFLDADDAALCPPGPRGTVFSYARRLSP